jgi:hypothetical protein
MAEIIVSGLGLRWDRARSLLWVDLTLEDGRSYSVAVPVALFALHMMHSLKVQGVNCCPEVGEDLASVDGFFSWVKRTAKKASRAVKHATKAATRAVAKTATQAVRAAKRYGGTALSAIGTGASMVPGIGTGIAAGIAAGTALARGQRLDKALLAGARGALPGGQLTAAALTAAEGIAQGKRVDRALLAGARNAVPGGELGKAAFDTALAIGRGQRPDRAIKAAAIRAATSAVPGGAGVAAAATALVSGKRVDRALLGAAQQIATTTVTGGKVDRFFPAVGGAGLSALAAANRVATAVDDARPAAARIARGVGTAADRSRLARVRTIAVGVRRIASSSSPEARLAAAALAHQPAAGASRSPQPPVVAGPLSGFDLWLMRNNRRQGAPCPRAWR